MNKLNTLNINSIIYNANNKEEAINLLDNPTNLIGAIDANYKLIFKDDIGDSPLGGGKTSVIGYTYSNNTHGAQLAIKYDNTIKFRTKRYSQWTEWKDILTINN